MRTLKALWLFLTSLITIHINKPKNEPVRLNKPKKQKISKLKKIKSKIQKISKYMDIILMIVGFFTLLILIATIIYQTGCLDSTNYYYRLGR